MSPMGRGLAWLLLALAAALVAPHAVQAGGPASGPVMSQPKHDGIAKAKDKGHDDIAKGRRSKGTSYTFVFEQNGKKTEVKKDADGYGEQLCFSVGKDGLKQSDCDALKDGDVVFRYKYKHTKTNNSMDVQQNSKEKKMKFPEVIRVRGGDVDKIVVTRHGFFIEKFRLFRRKSVKVYQKAANLKETGIQKLARKASGFLQDTFGCLIPGRRSTPQSEQSQRQVVPRNPATGSTANTAVKRTSDATENVKSTNEKANKSPGAHRSAAGNGDQSQDVKKPTTGKPTAGNGEHGQDSKTPKEKPFMKTEGGPTDSAKENVKSTNEKGNKSPEAHRSAAGNGDRSQAGQEPTTGKPTAGNGEHGQDSKKQPDLKTKGGPNQKIDSAKEKPTEAHGGRKQDVKNPTVAKTPIEKHPDSGPVTPQKGVGGKKEVGGGADQTPQKPHGGQAKPRHSDERVKAHDPDKFVITYYPKIPKPKEKIFSKKEESAKVNNKTSGGGNRKAQIDITEPHRSVKVHDKQTIGGGGGGKLPPSDVSQGPKVEVSGGFPRLTKKAVIDAVTNQNKGPGYFSDEKHWSNYGPPSVGTDDSKQAAEESEYQNKLRDTKEWKEKRSGIVAQPTKKEAAEAREKKRGGGDATDPIPSANAEAEYQYPGYPGDLKADGRELAKANKKNKGFLHKLKKKLHSKSEKGSKRT